MKPKKIVSRLVVAETGLLGVLLGVVLLYLALVIIRPLVDVEFGLYLDIDWLSSRELFSLMAIVVAGLLAGLLPALRACRLSLVDGMMVRSC